MSEYSIIWRIKDPKACAIHDFPEDIADPGGPAEGEPVGSDHVDGQPFHMAAEARGLQVPDVIPNLLGYLMVGERAKDVIAEHANADIEFLRFTLVNHKGRTATDRGFIVNVLGSVDCVDIERTKGREHPVIDGQYSRITELHLDEKRIPADANLFRISIRPRVLIVRGDLRERLEAAGLSGLNFLELGEKVRL